MVKSNIDKKFSAHYDAVEQELKSSTVGKWILEMQWLLDLTRFCGEFYLSEAACSWSENVRHSCYD